MKTIAIVGGGSSAHVLIPLLSCTKLDVRLLTRKPDKWTKEPELDYLKPTGEFVRHFKGSLKVVSDKPEDIVQGADIIMLCLPVHVSRPVLHRLAPHISKDKKVYIGTVYGQGGFNWMVDEIKKEYGLLNARPFAFGLIPWICRTETYGLKGIVYGAKPVNVAATESSDDFKKLNDVFFRKVVHDCFGHGEFQRADNFLTLTMSLDNQILHPSRMYGLYLENGGKWKSKEDIPLLYKDFSKLSARILKGLDSDYSKIRKRIRKKFKGEDFSFMLDYVSLDNKTNLRKNRSYLETFRNSDTLGAIETPVVGKDGYFTIDTGHRFFRDDVFYGLCIAKSIAQMFRIRTYHIDKTLNWAQKMMGEDIIMNYRLSFMDRLEEEPYKYGVPESYGLLTPKQLWG